MDENSSSKQLPTRDVKEAASNLEKATKQDENDPKQNFIVQNDGNETDDDVEEEDFGLKLDDLNDYCLEAVFKYLNLEDLMRVALSNSRFIGAVHFAARRIFRVRGFIIYVEKGSKW